MSFREFIGGSFGEDLNHSQVLLAKEVLAEIPDQVMSYMKKYNVRPNPPVSPPVAKTNPSVNPVNAPNPPVSPPVAAKPKQPVAMPR